MIRMTSLAKLKQLSVLEIEYTRIFDLEFLRELPELDELTLRRTWAVDASALEVVRVCSISVESYLVQDGDPSASVRTQRFAQELRDAFARRSCPRRCSRGCRVGAFGLRGI